MRFGTLVAALLMVSMIAAPLGQGATTRGKLRGAVNDKEGAPIAKMKVTATNVGNPAQVFTTESNKKGRFTFILDPVEYTFKFEKDGYRPYETEPIKIRATTQEIPFEIFSEEQYQHAVATVLAKTPTPQARGVRVKFNGAVDLFEQGMKAKKDEERVELLQKAVNDLQAILEELPEVQPFEGEELPDQERIQWLLGNIFWKLEDWEGAETAFAAVTELNPEMPEPYYYRGELAAKRAESAQGAAAKKAENAKAVELWNRYLELKPDDESIVYNLAVLAFQSNEFEIAAKQLQRTVEMKPDHASAFWLLGHSMIRLGNQPEAKKAFQRYLELQPEGQHAKDVKEILSVLP